MRTYYQNGILVGYLSGGVHRADILFFQGLYDLLVMNQRAKGIDLLTAVLGQFQHLIYGILYAGAEPRAFRHRYLHAFGHDGILTFIRNEPRLL